MTERKNVIFSPSSLKTYCECPRKYFYSRIARIGKERDYSNATNSKGGGLEKGDLMHAALRIYYKVRKLGHSVKIAREIARLGAHMHAGSLTISLPVCEFVLSQFDEYIDYYGVDEWKILGVEEHFSKVLYEDEELRIIIEGIVDLIADNGDFIAAIDHKTGAANAIPVIMGNQFKAYAWAGQYKYVVVNRINLQKTKAPKDKFFRYPLNYSTELIDNWKENAIYHARRALEHFEDQYWPQNETSCNNYGKCAYIDLCEARDSKTRTFRLTRDFQELQEARWSPTAYAARQKKEDQWIQEELTTGYSQR